MNDVTQILSQIESGDAGAGERLLPLVYDELRKLAAAKLAREQPGQTLQATALVHEAYLRLVDDGPALTWDGRGHFFAAAAEAMRRILVEHARRKRSLKRGGDLVRAEFDEATIAAPCPNDELLAVHEALDRLAATDPLAAELVKLRFFSGLTLPEAAAVINVSLRTANRLWAYAKAWLHREIHVDASSGGASPDSAPEKSWHDSSPDFAWKDSEGSMPPDAANPTSDIDAVG
ncbi:MAG: sigma-70 family RNA polymerase sigma factor [Alphaproteobacteria bacterium]|nr:sigma-70 family RNA polymerase sigma factor [Alphaproteobacteria bacterium]